MTNATDTRTTDDASPATDYRWVALPNAPIASSRTDDIWFRDELTGWLVNSSGYVSHTRDGGNSWERQLLVDPAHPAKPYLRTIQFAPGGSDVGWFGALCGTTTSYLDVLLHATVDGGQTWRAVDNLPTGSPQGICGLAVVNERVMYGAGSNDPDRLGPSIIKTTDGGKSWTLIDMKPHADNLIDVYFRDELRGFVVGGKSDLTGNCPGNQPWYEKYPQYARLLPVVLYTEDGGQTWRNLVAGLNTAFDCGSWGWKMCWLSDRLGFVAIEDFAHGAILKTTDGLDDWQMFRINDRRASGVSNANLEGIGFIDEKVGWVGGWGDRAFIGNYNSYTRDGGRNWVAQDHDPSVPTSDPRVNVNRYRFIGDAGYCSGKTVYKMARRGEPTATLVAPGERTRHVAAEIPLDLAVSGDAAGQVDIRFIVPAGTRRLYLGIWSHFGWHVHTLLDEHGPAAGARAIVWDGKDGDGVDLRGDGLIFRLTCDEQAASETLQLA